MIGHRDKPCVEVELRALRFEIEKFNCVGA